MDSDMTFNWLAKILVRQPVFVLLGISVLSISCTILPLLMKPLPDFSDPQKGFETRGTTLSNKIMAWRNLMQASKPMGPLTGNPKDFQDQRRYEEEQFKSRKRRKNALKNKKSKGLAKHSSRGNNNSVEDGENEEEPINEGIMRNSTTDTNKTNGVFHELLQRIRNNEFEGLREPQKKFFCLDNGLDGYVQVLIASTETDLFTAAGLYEVCRITKQLEAIAAYEPLCDTRLSDSRQSHTPGTCCRPWSLPNYIAQLHHHDSCLGVTEQQLLATKRQLFECARYFFDERSRTVCFNQRSKSCDAPEYCTKHKAFQMILTYLISTDYAQSNGNKSDQIEVTSKLHETMVFLPIPIGANTLAYYRSVEAQMQHLRDKDVSIVALNFGEERKHDVFNECLIRDSRLMILGGVCVLAFMWAYTNSAFLTFMTIIAILFSISLAFFIYSFCYEMTFFPFMNLLTFIVAIGVGSDDSFIFNKIWTTVKSENKDTSYLIIMTKTLDMALTSMAVTSATTAAAFMVSTLSAITAIRCFGIFAGTSVIVNYIVMALWIPSCFIIYERYFTWRDKKSNSAPTPSSTSSLTHHQHPDNSIAISLVGRLGPLPVITVDPAPAATCSGFLHSLLSGARCFCSMYRQRFFVGPMERIRSWILYVVTGPPLSSLPPAATTFKHQCTALPVFLVLTVIAVLSAVVIFHHPRLRLPESEEFQLFSDNHPFEQYDMVYKDKFFFKQAIKEGISAYKMPLRFVWGVLPIDDGNHLDPTSLGHLHYDPEFDVSSIESQEFLLGFCRALKRQPFYKTTSGPMFPNCFMSSFHSWMENRRCNEEFTNRSRVPCCQQTFPYDPDIFNKCIVEAMTDMYATPQEFLTPGMAGPKFNKDKFPAISAVVVEFESTFSFSLSYTEMNSFVNKVDAFFQSQLTFAPHTMKRGWFVSELAFYDLQHSLSEDTIIAIYISMIVALAILFGTTLNILTSLYAIFTIVCSILVTLAILVLSGWRLNILESVAVSSAIGLAVDFSLHYTIKYNHFSRNAIVESRRAATRQALGQMIGPTSMAALTTSTAGLFMLPSDILAYIRIGVFLITVMGISWVYATFHLGIMLALAGPERDFGQFRHGQLCETVRRKQRRRRRRRQARARSLQMQLAIGRTNEKIDTNNEAIGRIDSHELESLTQSADLSGGNVISSVDEDLMVARPVMIEEFEAVADSSGLQQKDFKATAGPSGMQRTASCVSSTQVQVHASLTRVVSNGDSSRGSVKNLNEQSPSTESATTIIMPDQDDI